MGESETIRSLLQKATGIPVGHPSIHEIVKIENDQRQTLSENFSSSELAYGGSDIIIRGSGHERLWRKLIKSELRNQHAMRRFVNSCLVTADKKANEVELLVTDLGSPDGMKRIREIVMFEMSVDAGLQSDIASFQRVVLPFLALLTRKQISDCSLEMCLNAIYAIIYTNSVILFFFFIFVHFVSFSFC